MWRDAALVAGKDLRVEARSRVGVNQVAPFALLVLIVFAFALDSDRVTLARVGPGLFWVTVLFSGLLAIQRSFVIEADDGARDGLRLSGLDGAGIFLGKAAAIAVQLAALEVVLAVGVVVLYGVSLHGPAILLLTSLFTTIGLAAAGTVYGIIAAGLRVRDTLLPLLVLPVLAPVLLAAARACDAALAGTPGDGWPWVRLLFVFATIYVTFGVVAFGPLLEET
ncbi:MAG TPA: heme exporter protein CcmB [Acidimicrobiales bacterium]|jgi:heme exporter protein B|nr:heme exporter protein CcmB [Acidimicrobiales bacterium]